jgi:N-acyl-D-amino-acid deacylase
MFDILIKGGLVVDGTGKPGYRADVGVSGDRIEYIGTLDQAEARRVIDATPYIVAPGFIDAHSHSDARLIQRPIPEPKVRQGITTEVVGQCGTSISPVTSKSRSILPEMVGWGLKAPTWDSFAGLRDVYEHTPLPVNAAFLVGHGALRMGVMGMDDRPPTSEEMAKMEGLLDRELDEGAIGFSTGLIYPPCSFSVDEEVTRLCSRSARADGVFTIHMRNEAEYLEESVERTLKMADVSGVRLQISHLKGFGRDNWSKMDKVIERMDAARASGVRVTCDQYPYVAGSTSLRTVLPRWVMDGGIPGMMSRLRDPQQRAKAKSWYDLDVRVWDNRSKNIGWENMVIASCKTDANRGLEGKNLKELAEIRKCDPADAMFDLLLEEEGAVSLVVFYGCEDNIDKVLRYKHAAMCTDAGNFEGQPHPRVYGSFPRTLGRYVRERGVIPVEEAVRKMTSLPASIYGLRQRGVLRNNAFADIVLFDPKTVNDRSTFTAPHQYPVGIEYVIVNGVTTIDAGAFTGQTGGHVLSH